MNHPSGKINKPLNLLLANNSIQHFNVSDAFMAICALMFHSFAGRTIFLAQRLLEKINKSQDVHTKFAKSSTINNHFVIVIIPYL